MFSSAQCEAPAEPRFSIKHKLGRSLALPKWVAGPGTFDCPGPRSPITGGWDHPRKLVFFHHDVVVPQDGALGLF